MVVRPPAVAGVFYPADPAALRLEVRRLLEGAAAPGDVPTPKALIVPHAALSYSGPVAASAYACVAALREQVRTVVLVGPAHYTAEAGVFLGEAQAFATPLGTLPVESRATALLRALPCVRVRDAVHAREHCLEVQLPFLQVMLGEVAIVPVLLGACPDEVVAELLETVWGGSETLVVISSDLSHYLPYDEARLRDAATAGAVEALAAEAIPPRAACGREGIRGVLRVAVRQGLEARIVDLRNSGDTGGERGRVVGYGAFVLGRRARQQ